MKIITMQRLTVDGKPATYDTSTEKGEDYRDWWCVIETEEEKIVYDMFVKNISSNIQSEALTNLWNTLVKHAGQDKGVSWGDDDIYGYISPNEKVPEIKGTFKDGDGDIWVRIQ